MQVNSRPSGRDRSLATDAGVVAVWVAIMAPVLFGVCAFAVDVARWYVEGARLQKTVDAAALAGVPFMPQDFTEAEKSARDFIGRNGFTLGPAVIADVQPGERPSQLRVTMSSTVDNTFAKIFGLATQTVTRSGVAEFTGPAPLGSPCNTFGNEPSGSVGFYPGAAPTSPYANCGRFPQFWGTAVGPDVAKTQGDRFLSRYCGGRTSSGIESGCDPGTPRTNCALPRHVSIVGLSEECKEDGGERGYVYQVRVFNPSAVTSVDLQIYDAAYVDTQSSCGALPDVTSNNLGTNTWVNDARNRYADDADPIGSLPSFCSGDNDNRNDDGDTLSLAPDLSRNDTDADEVPTITSFGLLQPTDTFNPFDVGANSNRVPTCAKQYPGFSMVNGAGGRTWRASTGSTVPNAQTLTQLSTQNTLTQYFHQWTSLCSFNPSLYVSPGTPEAVFYLRVRTNIPWGSTTGVFTQTGDSTAVRGNGSNRFSLRAVTAGAADVAVAAFERQAIFANSEDNEAEFNLVRVTPGSAGQNLLFSFFDVGDASGGTGATLTVRRPTDATGAGLSNCRAGLNGRLPDNQALPGCSISGIDNTGNASTTWNGRYQQIVVPIPSNYSCNFGSQGGCWFKVKVEFDGGASVTDQTTWTAFLEGDPVRLIK